MTPKNGGYRQRKSHSAEKNAIFDVFRKALSYNSLQSLFICNPSVYKIRICESLGFGARKTMFRRVKGHVSSHHTLPLATPKVRYGSEKPKLSQNEEL